MNRTFALTIAAALLGGSPFFRSTSAQVPISAGTYTQNFNSLASSGAGLAWTDGSTLPGWYACTNRSASARGPITVYRADAGSGSAGALYSYGAASASDRALGSVASGTPGSFAYGVRFINDLPEAVTNITISYTGEQWRNSGAAAIQTLAFSYLISDAAITTSDAANANTWTAFTGLDFSSPTIGSPAGALDGNAAANRQVFSAVPLPDVTVLPGQEIFFRWFDTDDAGSDHGLAIDDLAVTFNGSIAVTTPPTIAPGGQPQSRINSARTTATFTVLADGTEPLSYQWRKDGYNLSDSDNIFGSSSATLTLSNVFAADAGGYDVLVSNSADATTSAVAALTVIDPVISRQPVSRSALVGDTATFSIGAAGTPPVSYQWLFGGSPIADATDSFLSIPAVQTTNQGSYACIYTGLFGELTSAVATLSVTTPPGATLALWDFNDTNAPLALPPPAVGAGTAALLNGVTAAFATGVSADLGGINRAWNTSSYPPQGTANKLSGVQFSVSTSGYKDLLVTWQERHSNTASKYQRFQYSTNGTDFIDKDVLAYTVTDNSFVLFSVDLSGVAGVRDNAQFAYRVVTEWEGTAIGGGNNNYVGITSYGSGASGGTIRYDLMTVYGTATSANPTPILLHIEQADNGSVKLTWTDPAFSLQSAPAITGTYTTVPGATNPYTNAIGASPRFFRLQAN